ncbi:Fc.00g087580.m01.CDS01 [Cosmosporella sp. VM-42]
MPDSNEDSATTVSRPKTRQRTYKQPPPLAVPNIDDDAAERKRVLNVLAQRRYREKKRLSRLKSNTGKDTSESAGTSEEPETSGPSSTDVPPSIGDPVAVACSSMTVTLPSSATSPGVIGGVDLNFTSWDLSDPAFASLLPEPGPLPDFMATDENSDDNLIQSNFTTSGNGFTQNGFAENFGINPSSLNTSSSASDISFPDSYHLPVHELTLIKAMVRIAGRLNCKGSFWTLDCNSPFNSGTATPSNLLPAAWRPTVSQVMVPHHPMLDFLPWPTVRDRIINILELPDELRPPNAVGPLGLVNFAYDVEHNSEGVRIYGGDPYDPKTWEVGQVLFERWWFLFDREIIETSNQWRRMRGAPQLLMKGPNSEGSWALKAAQATKNEGIDNKFAGFDTKLADLDKKVRHLDTKFAGDRTKMQDDIDNKFSDSDKKVVDLPAKFTQGGSNGTTGGS